MSDKSQLITIKHNSENPLQLANELMDFRQVETGYLPLHVSENDIVSFITQILASFDEIALTKHITTEWDEPADPLLIWFDREQMGKVFYNLLSNAFKFTPENGFVSIVVRENRDSVIITISNNGKGVAKENLEKLFDNYFQEDDNEHRNTGYGIGLALAKSIIELHKGNTYASSDKRHNNSDYITSFNVTLLKDKKHFNEIQLSAKEQLQSLSHLTKQGQHLLSHPAAEPDNLHMHPIDDAFFKNIIKITEENLEDSEFGILRLK